MQLRRVLVALMVLAVWFTTPGCAPVPMEGAPELALVEAMAMFEPEIPEHQELTARRRQQAITLGQQVREWEANERMSELSPQQRRLVRQHQSLRQQELDRVGDLVPPAYRQMVVDVAHRFGLDPRLVAAIGTVESQWRPHARGASGDSGLMQIIPPTAAWISRRMGLAAYDLYDPLTNLTMGSWYLQALHKEHGSWDRALAAYNGGPRAASRGSQHPYVRRVMGIYHRQGSYE